MLNSLPWSHHVWIARASQTGCTRSKYTLEWFLLILSEGLKGSLEVSLTVPLPPRMWEIFPVGLVAQSCPTLCDPMDCSTPGFPVHHQLPELTQTHVHWVSDAIQPSHPLSSPSPPTFNLSQLQGLSNESALRIRWPKYWSFSFSISPSNEYSGPISFRMDRLDLLAVQRTPKNLLQHHSSKASILQCSAFFIVHLSHPYMTAGKTIALTRWTFVSKVDRKSVV